MIRLMFQYGNEQVEVLIKDMSCYFRTSQFMKFITIDGLKLDKKGVVKEFPELKDDDEWRTKAIIKFKEKIKNMNNEKEISRYIVNDLSKYGYIPLYMHESGQRPKKF